MKFLMQSPSGEFYDNKSCEVLVECKNKKERNQLRNFIESVSPSIVHKLVYSKNGMELKNRYSSVLVKKKLYLCNQAVGTTKGKYSLQWNKVTCKNCLLHKREE